MKETQQCATFHGSRLRSFEAVLAKGASAHKTVGRFFISSAHPQDVDRQVVDKTLGENMPYRQRCCSARFLNLVWLRMPDPCRTAVPTPARRSPDADLETQS
jgi:hypothetical protein